MSVAGEISQDFLRAAEWALAIDHPLCVAQWLQIGSECLRIDKPGMLAQELQLTGLMSGAEPTGKNLDENISSLVRKGLEVEIQQAMDVLQVVRKNPSQTTEVDLKEENEAAKIFLTSLRQILKRRMLKNHDEN